LILSSKGFLASAIFVGNASASALSSACAWLSEFSALVRADCSASIVLK
jgi:hypothetical protein